MAEWVLPQYLMMVLTSYTPGCLPLPPGTLFLIPSRICITNQVWPQSGHRVTTATVTHQITSEWCTELTIKHSTKSRALEHLALTWVSYPLFPSGLSLLLVFKHFLLIATVYFIERRNHHAVPLPREDCQHPGALSQSLLAPHPTTCFSFRVWAFLRVCQPSFWVTLGVFQISFTKNGYIHSQSHESPVDPKQQINSTFIS